MRFIEEVGEDSGLLLASMQPFAGGCLHRVAVARTYLSQGTLDVAVEQLIGVQIRRIARQKVQLDALGVFLEPALDHFGPMRRMSTQLKEMAA